MSRWIDNGPARLVPEDRPGSDCTFVGGPADGDERWVPFCEHGAMGEVHLDMPDGTSAVYGWHNSDQRYRFVGMRYPGGRR